MGFIFLDFFTFVPRGLIITKELKHLRSIVCKSFLYLSNCTVLGIEFYHAKVVLLIIWNHWFVKIFKFECCSLLQVLFDNAFGVQKTH